MWIKETVIELSMRYTSRIPLSVAVRSVIYVQVSRQTADVSLAIDRWGEFDGLIPLQTIYLLHIYIDNIPDSMDIINPFNTPSPCIR